MKKLSLLIASAIMIALAACSQQQENVISEADALTPEEQAKYDHYVALAVEAGCSINENATVAQKREFIQNDIESLNSFLDLIKVGEFNFAED